MKLICLLCTEVVTFRDSFQPDLTLEKMTSVCVTYWSLVGWFRHINKPTLGIST